MDRQRTASVSSRPSTNFDCELKFLHSDDSDHELNFYIWAEDGVSHLDLLALTVS